MIIDSVVNKIGTDFAFCKYKVVIIGDNNLEKLLPQLDPLNFKFIIIDECHFMRNGSTHRTKNINTLLKKINRCLLLSGTPAYSSIADIDKIIGHLYPENSFPLNISNYKEFIIRNEKADKLTLQPIVTKNILVTGIAKVPTIMETVKEIL